MLETVRGMLRCPRCHGPLVDDEGGALRCIDASCALGTEGPFPVVGGQPVLVDFSRSILMRERLMASGGASEIARGRGVLRGAMGRLMRGESSQAADRAAQLIREIRKVDVPSVVLVVGGGTIGSGAQALYETEGICVVGFDIYASPHTQFVADAHNIPLASESVDAVWVQAVLEHVVDPQRVVDEIARVLRPRGLVYAETPFMQQVHEGAYDFSRFSESGHRWLFRAFECLGSGAALGPGTATWWSLVYLMRSVTGSHRLAEVLALPFIWLRFLDRLASGRLATDAASAIYFLGRKGEHALAVSELIDFYHRRLAP